VMEVLEGKKQLGQNERNRWATIAWRNSKLDYLPFKKLFQSREDIYPDDKAEFLRTKISLQPGRTLGSTFKNCTIASLEGIKRDMCHCSQWARSIDSKHFKNQHLFTTDVDAIRQLIPREHGEHLSFLWKQGSKFRMELSDKQSLKKIQESLNVYAKATDPDGCTNEKWKKWIAANQV
jgi:hypothetical protein